MENYGLDGGTRSSARHKNNLPTSHACGCSRWLVLWNAGSRNGAGTRLGDGHRHASQRCSLYSNTVPSRSSFNYPASIVHLTGDSFSYYTRSTTPNPTVNMRSSFALAALGATAVLAQSTCTATTSSFGTSTITDVVTSTYCPVCDEAKATGGVYTT